MAFFFLSLSRLLLVCNDFKNALNVGCLLTHLVFHGMSGYKAKTAPAACEPVRCVWSNARRELRCIAYRRTLMLHLKSVAHFSFSVLV